MSLTSRRELTRATLERYQLADRAQKALILNEYVEATGYHRKYAICLLQEPQDTSFGKVKGVAGASMHRTLKTPGTPGTSGTPGTPGTSGTSGTPGTRRRRYDKDVERALLQLWAASDHLCSKRLIPFLPDLIEALERHGELAQSRISDEVRARLLTMSAATCDRLLSQSRRASPMYGKTTTKPGTLLKHQIPIRTFADWKESERRPGFCEVDLVAHCGDTTAGEYLNTLTLTDVFTGWTECQPILNRSQNEVSLAIEVVRKRLPFPLLGIDSDNGGEFINGTLLRYCDQHKITFTRCRPYKKNDQCHVEQKNWAVVRQKVGYSRMEGEAFVHLLSRLYLRLRLHLNYFQPSLKLLSKTRDGARVRKTYDTAQTPFRRLLAWQAEHSEKGKESAVPVELLEEGYLKLNPAQLRRQVEAAQTELQKALVEKSIEVRSDLRSDLTKAADECIK